eukprot:TRINITY_DN27460_c0_g1_i1.p1 TRINITY_DN27460_c0_g1~~TRINITY_DN27460_c0_g1_i1.p1  ORF type:complete len:455 (-),score=113.78 TRINITY_DN27460_c0_g1_i1:188-1552(-)
MSATLVAASTLCRRRMRYGFLEAAARGVGLRVQHFSEDAAAAAAPGVLPGIPPPSAAGAKPGFGGSMASTRIPRASNVHNEQTLESERTAPPDHMRYASEIRGMAYTAERPASVWPVLVDKFQSIENPSTVVYNAMIAAADKCKRFEDGMRLFRDMQRLGIPQTGVSYGAALNVLGRRGRFDEAKQLWQEMLDAGILPTPASLTGLVNSAAVAGRPDDVQACIEEGRQRGVEIQGSHYGCKIRAYRELRDPRGALAALTQTLDEGVDVQGPISWVVAMGACSRAVAAGEMQPAAVDEFIRDFDRLMAQWRVPKSDPILEEQVRARLGRGPNTLTQWLRYGCKPECLASAKEAFEAIETAEQRQQLFRSRDLLLSVKEHLKRYIDAGGQSFAASSPAPAAAAAAVTPPASPAAATPPPMPSLPEGWSEAVDPASGKTYYWKVSDPAGTTTWERPS